MAVGEIHVGDIGTVFTVTILDQDSAVVDISSATTKNMIFKKPDGTKVTKTGVFVSDGTDGKMKYTTVSGDIDAYGEWKLQGFIDLGSTEWYTDFTKFTVHRNL
jgi:hypothetical protein